MTNKIIPPCRFAHPAILRRHFSLLSEEAAQIDRIKETELGLQTNVYDKSRVKNRDIQYRKTRIIRFSVRILTIFAMVYRIVIWSNCRK